MTWNRGRMHVSHSSGSGPPARSLHHGPRQGRSSASASHDVMETSERFNHNLHHREAREASDVLTVSRTTVSLELARRCHHLHQTLIVVVHGGGRLGARVEPASSPAGCQRRGGRGRWRSPGTAPPLTTSISDCKRRSSYSTESRAASPRARRAALVGQVGEQRLRGSAVAHLLRQVPLLRPPSSASGWPTGTPG